MLYLAAVVVLPHQFKGEMSLVSYDPRYNLECDAN